MAEILIPDDDARDQYTASASQTIFPYTFPIFDQTVLIVKQTVAATSVTSTLALTTDYTVSGVDAAGGGNVTLLVGAASGDTITIERDVPVARNTDFQVAGDYRAETINRELDLIVMMMQQLERDINRTVTLKTEDTSSSLELPTKTERSDQALGFDSNGDAIALSLTTPSTIPSPVSLNYIRSNLAGTAHENRTVTEVKTDLGIDLKEDITSATGSAVTPSGTTAQRDGSPVNGYFRYNSTLGQFEGYAAGAWGAIGGGATGGSSDAVFYENEQTVTADYTLSTNNNAHSVGPITINTGITVTVPSGSNWVIS